MIVGLHAIQRAITTSNNSLTGCGADQARNKGVRLCCLYSDTESLCNAQALLLVTAVQNVARTISYVLSTTETLLLQDMQWLGSGESRKMATQSAYILRSNHNQAFGLPTGGLSPAPDLVGDTCMLPLPDALRTWSFSRARNSHEDELGMGPDHSSGRGRD